MTITDFTILNYFSSYKYHFLLKLLKLWQFSYKLIKSDFETFKKEKKRLTRINTVVQSLL